MKILFVLQNYYPNDDANSNCVTDLAQQLIKNKNEIHILCMKYDNKIDDFEIYNNIYIHRIEDKGAISRKNYYKKWNNQKINIFKKLFLLFNLFFIKIFFIIEQKFNKTNILFYKTLVTSMKITKLHVKYSFNIVIPVCEPFYTCVAVEKAKKRKKNNFAFIVYQLDPFTNNETKPKRYIQNRENIEKRVFNKANKIIVTDLIYSENKNNSFVKYIDKMISLKFPNIKKLSRVNCLDDIILDKNYINCVFVGNFYTDIRNPEYTLNLFLNLKNKNIKFIIIGEGMNNIVEKYINKSNGTILKYYKVSKNVAYNVMLNADIMINIGNTTTNQMPSKIFDYISTGKPIVNFYKFKDCPTLQYSEKYPTCLNIFEGEELTDLKIHEFETFCTNNLNKVIDYCDIQKLYSECVTENVGKKFYDIIKIRVE